MESRTLNVPQYGRAELTLHTTSAFGNPYTDVDLKVEFTLPDGSIILADGFYDGGNCFRARAYACRCGVWRWRSLSSHPDMDGQAGEFAVHPSLLPGKLRIHPRDPYQFAYDNGEWFLHIGDTGYRYLASAEAGWQEYLDQAAACGFTKIRTWFSLGRSDVKNLLEHNRKRLNLAYWQEMDRRLAYAWSRYPRVMLQLIPFGEDLEEVLNYGEGEEGARLILKNAIARFSAYSNVQWCFSNDLQLESSFSGKSERAGQEREMEMADRLKTSINRVGGDSAVMEPWGTLRTNHQSRFSGYSFLDAPWSDLITLEDLGQVDGAALLHYRSLSAQPAVLDEDRYESWRAPCHPRYFFRRLMWASLLSGGHATYGGLRTWDAYDGDLCGMQGYFKACGDGKLSEGAHDFVHIHRFFRETGLSLAGMIPDDGAAGADPLRWKACRDQAGCTWIIYLANPDQYEGHAPDGFDGLYTDELAAPSCEPASVALPAYVLANAVSAWYNPSTGQWIEADGSKPVMISPGGGDWVLLVRGGQAV
ncbi:DUF5060 domain-containing protein [Paenibacillus mesotrionivorans]|uniref:DUF5060 domain-containing protein n=1 Tax=Paenibacillus mesotrionivorans TaxID=3160968 RepID=A0ACC7NRW0_9BACL